MAINVTEEIYVVELSVPLSDLIVFDKAYAELKEVITRNGWAVKSFRSKWFAEAVSSPGVQEALAAEIAEEAALNETGYTLGKPSQTHVPEFPPEPDPTDKEDLTVEPEKTRTAIGQWCSQCKVFSETTIWGIGDIGQTYSFTCPQCGYESHPTVTTHEVPV